MILSNHICSTTLKRTKTNLKKTLTFPIYSTKIYQQFHQSQNSQPQTRRLSIHKKQKIKSEHTSKNKPKKFRRTQIRATANQARCRNGRRRKTCEWNISPSQGRCRVKGDFGGGRRRGGGDQGTNGMPHLEVFGWKRLADWFLGSWEIVEYFLKMDIGVWNLFKCLFFGECWLRRSGLVNFSLVLSVLVKWHSIFQ